MCNAAKHSPGCTCGFGPPYPPAYSIGKVTEWADEVLDRPRLVRRGLREIGWDPAAIRNFAERYADLQRSDLPRSSRVQQVRELLKLRRRVIEESWMEIVEVPLYRFGAPPVRGAKVEYSEGDSVGDDAGWKVKIFGIGIGSTTTVDVARSFTCAAKDGAWKQVYVPVALRVDRVAVYDSEVFLGRGHVAQVASAAESGDPLLQRRGVRSVDENYEGPAASDGTISFHEKIDVALSGDRTREIHKEKRSWTTDVSRELSVPLARVIDVSALVKVKRTRRLQLAFELPSGHDYRAYLCNGFTLWESPRSSTARVARRSRKKD